VPLGCTRRSTVPSVVSTWSSRPPSATSRSKGTARTQQAIDDPALGHEPVQGTAGGEQALEHPALGQQLVQRAAGGQGAAERTVLGGEHSKLFDPGQRTGGIAEPAELLDRALGREQDADALLVAPRPAERAVLSGQAAGGDDQLRAGDRGPGRQRGDREQPHGADPRWLIPRPRGGRAALVATP